MVFDKFDGKNFANLKSRLKAKMSMINAEHEWMFEHFEALDRHISDDDFTKDQTMELDQARIKLSKELKGLMFIHVSYELRSTSRFYQARLRALEAPTGSIRPSIGSDIDGKVGEDHINKVRRQIA